MKNQWSISEECLVQIEMITDLCGNDQSMILELITKWGAEMRLIVKSFEETKGRPPTKEEIKWVLSEHLGRDVDEIAKGTRT
jgi:hypothetical protein